ncbi:hypothetical protein CDEF62S_00557 [Castellaniella defragrans]
MPRKPSEAGRGVVHVGGLGGGTHERRGCRQWRGSVTTHWLRGERHQSHPPGRGSICGQRPPGKRSAQRRQARRREGWKPARVETRHEARCVARQPGPSGHAQPAGITFSRKIKQLERRGHRFVRYADDCNVYVRSRRAGERVMGLLRRLYARPRLTVNETKSAVASVFADRKFLGYSFWVAPKGVVKRRVTTKALVTFKQRVRQLTRRSDGGSL